VLDIIAVLARRGLVITITVEPYLGQGGAGPLYGPPVEVEAYVEARRRLVRDTAERLVSSTTVYCRLSVVAPVKSRTTVRGQTGYVLSVLEHDGGRGRLPSHRELLLT
jgi:hypothetical protein